MKKPMKVVYVAHPLGSGIDRENNRIEASRWVAHVANLGFAPIADWIIISGEWDESKREQGLEIDFALIGRCDELWLCGDRVSPGMRLEAVHALSIGLPVYRTLIKHVFGERFRMYEIPDEP